MGKYTYEKHRFRFAAWAAGNATRRGISLTAKDAHNILKATDFSGLAKKGVEWLPDPEDFDAKHRIWCEKICKKAKLLEISGWSHGRSAKLINVFIKDLMPPNLEFLPAEEKAKWYAVHPPIDRKVLENMKEEKVGGPAFWSPFPAWTTFEANEYQSLIDMIREDLRTRLVLAPGDPVPLWKNEQHWKP